MTRHQGGKLLQLTSSIAFVPLLGSDLLQKFLLSIEGIEL